MSEISIGAASAREAARQSNGEFGRQVHAEQESELADDLGTCARCGTDLGDVAAIRTGQAYCANCALDLGLRMNDDGDVETCDECGAEYDGERAYCDDCMADRYGRCSDCGSTLYRDGRCPTPEAHADEQDEDDEGETCDDCGAALPEDLAIPFGDDMTLCQRCVDLRHGESDEDVDDDVEGECDRCGRELTGSQVVDGYCPDCDEDDDAPWCESCGVERTELIDGEQYAALCEGCQDEFYGIHQAEPETDRVDGRPSVQEAA